MNFTVKTCLLDTTVVKTKPLIRSHKGKGSYIVQCIITEKQIKLTYYDKIKIKYLLTHRQSKLNTFIHSMRFSRVLH